MADVERLLLAKVIRDKRMLAFLDTKITRDYFLDAEHLQVFDWMHEHFSEFGTSPGEQALRDNYPSWKLPDTPEPLDYYVKRLRKRHKYNLLEESVADAAGWLEDGDEREAELTLQRALNTITTTITPLRDHNLTDPESFKRLFDYYTELTKAPDDLRGLSTGWPTLDLATMGLQSGQLITLVGPPKGGKSTVLLSMGSHIQHEHEVDVLYVSFEMGYDEMVARWTGIRARTNYRRLLKGKMNEIDRKRLGRLQKQLNEGEAKLVLSEDITSTTTVSGIVAKIQAHNPRVVLIDGVYMMDDENGEPKGSAAAITNITRSLKRVAQLFQIPIVITTQVLYSKMRGQSIKAASIGYSSSFGQDSDTVIAVEPRENSETEAHEHWLKVLLSRSGPQMEVQIDFDWSTSTFTEYGNPNVEDDPDEDDDGQVRIGREDDDAAPRRRRRPVTEEEAPPRRRRVSA